MALRAIKHKIIQDFVQKTTQSELDQEGNEIDNVPASSSSSCRHWLLRFLSTHAREAEAHAISLKDIFPAVDCHTLFLPSVRRAHLADLSTATEADLTEEYRAERDALLKKLRTGAVPKRLKKHLGTRKMTGEEVDEDGVEEFTGTELALLLRVLVGAANAGSLTDIPNRWDAFLEQLQKSAVEDCYRFYQAHLASVLTSDVVVKSGGGRAGSPVNERLLAAWHTVFADKANALLAHLLYGLPTSLQSSRPKLADHLARYYASVSELNRQRLHLRLHALQKEGEMKVVDAFLATPLPLLQRQLQAQADVLLAQVSAQFVADVGDLVDREEVDEKKKKKKAEVDDPLRPYLSSLEKAVRLNLDSTLLRNSLQLEALFENATAALLQTAFAEVSIDLVRPPKREAFEALLRRSADLTTAAYAEERPLYAAKEAKLKLSLLERAQALREDNEAAVSAHLKSEAGKLVHEFERLTDDTRRHFPMSVGKLMAVLQAETDKFRRLFTDDLRPRYDSYGALFEEVEALLAEDLQTLSGKRAEENIAVFMEEVELPLALAKRSVLLSSSRYGTLFSWRRFAVSSAQRQLEHGRARGWSPSLKAAIINSWLQEDEELAREAANRRNALSRLLGFFQWLFSLLFG
ncbi:Guanylate-binding protein, N-terminal domain [Tyrophagus putrescentiae]|nr:Guanylate-binding protein, N-terminal domain [Tyrophagus putrescentiae]